ncbi:DsbA family oxidoreductase [Halomonas lysinitropha]|uniref:DSBA-like thioredoxin domain protein n=1 Tax=Halomonas lysinitropha TaxID=2607506 RepID=A0A5K1I2H9_9GAMM|nr:DsbA family protein [Halomonas lysinitropha]VVZ95576.1 DSBA-like thioredoxin domain protein [Halomonas lysinitropha]
MTRPRITLDVFSDYVCPFCYLEAPEIDALAERFGDIVAIRWRAFELRPEPEPTLDPDGDYLHDIWERAVYPMAAERGMMLRLPRLQPRSRLAHEASAWARTQEAVRPGATNAMRTALFRGFFEESLDLADTESLVRVAQRLDMDGQALRQALVEGKFRQQVRDDQQIAREVGIGGVPGLRFSLDGEHAGVLEGAQPRRQLFLATERLLDAIR